MTHDARRLPLGAFARAGFQELSAARDATTALAGEVGLPIQTLIDAFSVAPDPDAALSRIAELERRHPNLCKSFDGNDWQRLALLFGASPALGDFFARHPARLAEVLRGGRVIEANEARRELLRAVSAQGPEGQEIADVHSEAGAAALRVRYRELLAETVMYDLSAGLVGEPSEAFDEVAHSFSVLADAALEAGLAVARGTLIAGVNGAPVSADRVRAAELTVIAMGKCGALELNVVSDVDVMFVARSSTDESAEDALDPDTLMRVATRLATETMRAVHDHGLEPPLWQVDPNLRPEGRHGPLVRTLPSMLAYYERWAKTWEFQALLKARPAAGCIELGEEFVEKTRSMVWASSGREDFVGSVQRMRERVTEHIDVDDLDYELKLGPGGLRDIEFSVQLLQLVHGQYDESLRIAGTLPALQSLVAGGYVARDQGESLALDYRRLRVLEHRLQLRELRRTALMPRDDEGLRVLARASQLAPTSSGLLDLWRSIRSEVRELHLKIFYAPLLNAVAALPGEGFALGTEQALARLHSIGFRDPQGAMRHLTALTKGSSRTARIQRNLLPVLLPWLADGTDPDYGLLAFRRVSEASLHNHWYLRLLRDGSEAAERLMRVLSTSRFASELLETMPDAVQWLERDDLLKPVALETLLEEMRALVSRRDNVEDAAHALRAVHRREILRLALGRLVFVIDDGQVARGLDAAHTALLDGLLMALRVMKSVGDASEGDYELTLVAMGRYGGSELGLASDLDLLAVYRGARGASQENHAEAKRKAERLISELRALVEDPRFAVDLDFDLRPEGKNGPIVRSLDAYQSYYERWSLTWEAQALLRARIVAGDKELGSDFIALADNIRYRKEFSETEVREVRRIKARVEAERLPRGVDPKRHLKLGPGGLSDVEWLVQLLQLRYAGIHEQLRTTSTRAALSAAVSIGVLKEADRAQLEAAWLLASQIRAATKLWSGRSSDVLPTSRSELDGIARILGMPTGSTSELEERWFAASRRARTVFEREFFGYSNDLSFTT